MEIHLREKSICISGNIDLNSQEWVAIGNSKSGDPKEIKGDIIIRDAVIKIINSLPIIVNTKDYLVV